MPTIQELLAVKKQEWSQQYGALQQRANTYRVVVEQLSYLNEQQGSLTAAQTAALEGAMRSQLESEYAQRQFLNSPGRFQAEIDALNRRLQNDGSLSLFDRNRIQGDIDLLGQQRDEFDVFALNRGWRPPDYTQYSIDNRVYDNQGTAPRWDLGTRQGAFRNFVDTEILDPLKNFGNSVYETFRPFVGGATAEETYAGCAAFIDYIAGGGVSKIFRAPVPTSTDPIRQELYDQIWGEAAGQAWKPGADACKFILPRQNFREFLGSIGVDDALADAALDRLPEYLAFELPTDAVQSIFAEDALIRFAGGELATQPGGAGQIIFASFDGALSGIEPLFDIDPRGFLWGTETGADFEQLTNAVGYRQSLSNGTVTTTLNASNQLTVTVDRQIDGHQVQVEFLEDEWGELRATRVLSVDGNAAASPTAFAKVLDDQGYDPWEYAEGSAGDPSAASLDSIYQSYNPTQASGLDTLINGIGTVAPTIIDALSLIKAIQSGEPLPIVASGLRLTNDLVNSAGQPVPNYSLSGAANAASGILSLMSLDAALQQGDTLGALTAGTQAVAFGARAYLDFAAANNVFSGAAVDAASDISGLLDGSGNGVPGVLPVLSLVNSIVNGDEAGIAVSTLNVLNSMGVFSGALAQAIPVIGWAYAIYSIIDAIFGGDDIPDPWGTGSFVWNGNGITYQTAGETGGNEAVQNVMGSVVSTLNSLIEQSSQQNLGGQLGIIPNRMPTVGYDTSGFRFTDIDPLSGAEKHPALRFDTSGKPYNATPGSPESFQSLIEGMVYSALGRGAIAPMWEVLTAKAQTDAGDPKAGLTEEERAARDGKLAAPVTGATQTFRPVVLDIDGDGIETVGKNVSGVAFDVDDSGFLKQTGWVAGGDAFLTLDRDYNGQTNSGKEMFSNSMVDLSRRGLAGMEWVDSNFDGKLTSLDPVWNELRVWLDDGDGVDEAGEKLALSALGITELNYSMGTFTQNGQVKQLASPNLDADSEGTRINVVPDGILLQNSGDGQISLLVTRVEDLSAVVEANRDGVTGYEDTETIISGADLLANDTVGGLSGGNLSITGVSNFRHGTGFLDANGFVHFNPEADYAGTGAGFDYLVQASNGQAGAGGVDITLQNVNDAPTAVDQRIFRPIYGYTTDEKGATVPVYSPYYGATTPIAQEDTGDGRVIGSDVDDPASSLTYQLVGTPQYGAVTIDPSGNYDYTAWSSPGVPSGYMDGGTIYPGSDSFQLKITDPHGASITKTITVPHPGGYTPPTPSGGGGGCCPVAIDLDRNGFAFTSAETSDVFFDINADGWKRQVSWTAPGDGWLAIDANSNGLVDDGTEIVFTKQATNSQTDLQALAEVFDSNHDGLLSAADEKWAKFGVWNDANQNGVTDAGEFKSLATLGIESIELANDGQFAVQGGSVIHGLSTVHMVDGSTMAAADVTLKVTDKVLASDANGNQQAVTTSAFSPSGQELEGTSDKDLILGQNGNNVIKAYAGDDVIFEDGGNDIIDAGDGNDIVYAGADNDLVMAGGGDDSVYAGLGNDVVFGGDGHDAILLEGGNDIAFGGMGNDMIAGGWGNDVISGDEGDDQLYGEAGSDALFGGTGDDELLGMDGNDRLDGGAGVDLLDGGAGDDDMYGGAGNDTYVVDSASDTVTERADEGTDTVKSAVQYTLGNNLENLTLVGSASINGTGNTLNNILLGNDAANILDGGAGADTMQGGLGNDVYMVDNAGDVVIEAAQAGTDDVYSSVTYTLASGVENLHLTGTAAINGTGNELDNFIAGNSAANTLAGGQGNDVYWIAGGDSVVENLNEGIDAVNSEVSYVLADNLENLYLWGSAAISGTGNALNNILSSYLNTASNALAGGAGNDTYYVGAGDTVVELFNQGIDGVNSYGSFTLGDNVENLTLLGSDATNGFGNALNNIIIGNGAANTLSGGAGADTMIGGAGNDTYVIDNFGDVVTENGNEGVDTVQTGLTYTLGANIENLILTGTGAINGTGNALDNILTGNSAVNVLNGAAGNDLFMVAGDSGSDTVSGGDGFDEIRGSTGDDIIRFSTFTGTNTVERIDGGTGYNRIVSGAFFANMDFSNTELVNIARIEGSAGNGQITGSQGNDVILGGAASDMLNGGLGNDLFMVVGDSGYDTISGGDGFDEIRGSTGDDVIGFAIFTGANTVERIDGGTGYNRITSTYFGNMDFSNTELVNIARIEGGAGDSQITGSQGNDVILGGAASDRLNGGLGNDLFMVAGDSGSDTVSGGDGFDEIRGSTGDDIIRFATFTGTNTVERIDGGAGYNRIVSGAFFANMDFSNTELVNIARIEGGAGDSQITGSQGNDVILGGAGGDKFTGGLGNDTYLLGRGSGGDTIIENDSTAGNTDVAQFLSGVTADQIWFQHVGNNLEASIIGTGDKLVVKDWYLGSANHVEQFKTTDGAKTLLDSNVANLVNAMASFTPPAAGQTTLPTNYQTNLASVIAANWQ
ncbi:Ig-like domain-containing protein [Thiobacillus sp.]|uniref:beta strand repeat-containing protein n=3 Tax=unclassified Thiobacillus TaxID=2646513 RepID=UPI001AC40876|nr:Ig-like domain-containing protein [Thiobacillus sp.]MBN8779576.1 cadherin-like domain-containing protein [Thiobacillus sp.]